MNALYLLTFGAGMFFTGIAITLKVIFFFLGRHSHVPGESCFGNILVVGALTIALYFYITAFIKF